MDEMCQVLQNRARKQKIGNRSCHGAAACITMLSNEGKHYECALGHVAKKLNRVIFSLMNTGEVYLAKT